MRKELVLLVIAVLSGCHAYRDVVVTVLDAESRQPIAGASVDASYQEGLFHSTPRPYRAVADRDGRAVLRVAADSAGIFITPSADGYLPYWAGGAFPDGTPYVSGPYTELRPWPFAALTLTLYREPAPLVTLIVPDDYRGVIRVEQPYSFPPPPTNRQRHFNFNVRPGEPVIIVGAPPVEGGRLPIEVRSASGDLIGPQRAPLRDDRELRLWRIWRGELPLPEVRRAGGDGRLLVSARRGTRQCEVYLIGTLAEQREAQRASQAVSPLGGPLPADFKLSATRPSS